MKKLTPYDVFLKSFWYPHMIDTKMKLLYTSLNGFGDKLFVIEQLGSLEYIIPEFVVTDCDKLTKNEVNRYSIMLKQLRETEREKEIMNDLEHYQYSKKFVSVLGL